MSDSPIYDQLVVEYALRAAARSIEPLKGLALAFSNFGKAIRGEG